MRPVTIFICFTEDIAEQREAPVTELVKGTVRTELKLCYAGPSRISDAY